MRKILHGAVLINILLFFSSLQCVVPISSGGSSSETVIGKMVNSDGSPACSTMVTLYPDGYDPIRDAKRMRLASDITDANGTYRLEVIDTTVKYSIIATMPRSGARARITDIIPNGDTTRIKDAILSRPGVIVVQISKGFDLKNGYLYIPGTNIAVLLSGRLDYVILDSVPAGSIFPIHYRAVESDSTSKVIKDSVVVLSNDTMIISYTEWKFSKKLYLNTSASGADVSSNVYDFPALIRLTSNNFDFSIAKSAGDDLRFTNGNGTPLPYEIERWDTAAQSAEIWVKVDTVYGNNDNQYIVMYWGNTLAQAASSSAAVFDTSSGFQGVWHLYENGDITNDATSNAFNGINYGATPVEGIIGNAKYFSNGSNIQIPGLLNSPSSITLSAWVSAGPTDSAQTGNLSQEIVSIGDAVLIRLDNATGIGTCGSYHNSVNTVGNDNSFAITGSGQNLANTGWHYIVFSINSATHVQTFYIDGEQCAVSNDVNPITYDGLGNNTFIGIHGNGLKTSNFNGLIDEVRVNKTTLSSDWVKLCYMNQKEQDALIKW